MTFLPTLRSTSIPFAWRTLLLASAFFLVLVFNADHVRGQTPPDEAPPDLHADNPFQATFVPFGSSVDGRIDPSTDVDFFVFDLSDQPGPTDVWIYATGDLDSLGGLFDSNLDLLWVNDDSRVDGRFRAFQIRAILEPDYYFVLVRSWRSISVGDYTLHIEPVSNPSDSSDTPTQIDFESPIPGRFDARRETHHFRFDITEQTNVFMRAETPIIRDGDRMLIPFMPLDPTILDADGAEVSVNIYALVVRILSTGDRFRFGFIIQDDFAPGSYTLELTTPADDYETTYPGFYTIQAVEDSIYTEFIDTCGALTQSLDDPSVADPLYACQWHLDQPNGEDVNVKPVWDDGLMGEGINVAVVDTGMDWTHEDLVDNVDSSLNHDYTGEGDIYHPFSHHATNVAGLIAARDNDQGVRGVAPRATIYGHNLLDAPSPPGSVGIADTDIAHAAANNSGVTAVSNNSWGPVDGPEADGAPALWELAIENGVTRGYDGRGVFYVWAAGNGHDNGDDSNLDGYANFYAVTAACAVSELGVRSTYSEMGANLWVCAPGSDPYLLGDRGIVTVENSDRYIDDFNGTSAATPIVSGVAALVREANPSLTWRDLKLVLAESARKNDPTNPGWEDGARMYGLASDADRYHFNHEYGFGVVDAAAAVDLARSWTNLPPLQEAGIQSARIDRLIPDAYAAASIETVTLTLTLNSGIEFTEFVEINTVFQHNSFRDLDIEFESPSGAISRLAVPFDTFTDDDDPDDDYVPMRGPYRFGSAKHLGEDPNGVWTLRITDRFRLGTGAIESWGITVYGHTPDNILPSFAEGETTSRSVAENTPAGDPVGHPVAATDNEALNYTLGGPDTALFAIDAATGQLTVGPGTTLDYEDLASTDHEYQVTVTAADPSGATATTTVTITVTDVSLGTLGDSYDADHNETISRDEVIQAIQDYFAGILTLEEAVEVIQLYFSP